MTHGKLQEATGEFEKFWRMPAYLFSLMASYLLYLAMHVSEPKHFPSVESQFVIDLWSALVSEFLPVYWAMPIYNKI